MGTKQVDILLSDYDGTLCPTTSVREDGSDRVGMVSNEQGLVCIAKRIPVCTISSRLYIPSRKTKIC